MKLFLTCLLLVFIKTQQNIITYDDKNGNKITVEGELPEKINLEFLKSEINGSYFLGNDFPKTNYHIYLTRIKKMKKNIYYLSANVKTIDENNEEVIILKDIKNSVYEIKTEKNEEKLKIQSVNYQFSENEKGNFIKLPQFLPKIKN